MIQTLNRHHHSILKPQNDTKNHPQTTQPDQKNRTQNPNNPSQPPHAKKQHNMSKPM